MIKLLKAAINSKDSYEAIINIISSNELDEHSKIILRGIGDYYKKDTNCSSVDIEVLSDQIVRDNKRYADSFKKVLEQVKGTEVSEKNFVGNLIAQKLEHSKQYLVQQLASNADYNTLKEIWNEIDQLEKGTLEFRDLALHETETYTSEDFKKLLVKLNSQEKVPMYPANLNAELKGGVGRKSHVVVFGRPDSGKTTFVINQLVGCIKDGRKVLYYGNEDAIEVVMSRILQAYFNKTSEEISANIDKAVEAAGEALGRLLMVESASGSLSSVEKQVATHKPDLFIVDQIRNIEDGSESGRVLQLEQVAARMRIIAKKYDCVAMSVTQAGESAEDKLTLTMSDIDFNKTGIQSTADLIIGIGVNNNAFTGGYRRASFPKNKVSGTRSGVDFNIDIHTARIY